MSKTLNFIKDAVLWQVDIVDGHPWLSLGAIWLLAVLTIAL